MDIYQTAKDVRNKKDFEIFLGLLKENFENSRSDWENDRLDLFLEGLYGYNFGTDEEQASWASFAEMLLAARIYE